MVREIHFPPKIVEKNVQIPWTKEQVMEVFKSFDKDEDGRLSKEELKASFKKLGSLWSSFRAWRALGHADANKDGFISMQEIGELISYALKRGYKM
ncbi:calcium-binding protein CML10 [Pyrus ussuriensis x Pyrus communis]|uniref:Calcium-binding protein CML10 n=1 Tax=Pyrus ussuriensis x Pyrus communis TaxID=2448454 RepID=A0A5N5GUF6_9ROSA|nr:calcium-binding protein CML10 [Pyrus ussuriensis x Pyrus communis]